MVNIKNRGYVCSGGTILKLLLLLFLTNICFAQEQIVDFEEKSLPVLNEELRQIDVDIDDNADDITTNKGGVMMDASDTIGYLGTKVKNSIENDSDDLQLVGDESAPGNSKFYGTDGAGAKGWQAAVSDNVLGFDNYPTEDTATYGAETANWYTVDINSELWIYKTAEVTTCKMKFEGKTDTSSGTNRMRVDCGGVNGTSFTITTSYVTYTKTVDISGLSNNEFYRVTIEANNSSWTGSLTAYVKNSKIAVY